MRRIEQLLPIAIEAVVNQKIPKEGNVIANEFKGYIDAFGSMIVQNGLLPAVVFFENSGGDDVKEKRKKLLKAVFEVIKTGFYSGSSFPPNIDNIKDFILSYNKEKPIRKLRQQVVDAGISVKLALRTFTFEKSE